MVENVRENRSYYPRTGESKGVQAIENTHSGARLLESYTITGSSEEHTTANLKYKIRRFHLTEHDKHALQMDPHFIPSPRLPQNSLFSFELPTTHRLL